MATNSSSFDQIDGFAARANNTQAVRGSDRTLSERVKELLKTWLRYYATYYRE